MENWLSFYGVAIPQLDGAEIVLQTFGELPQSLLFSSENIAFSERDSLELMPITYNIQSDDEHKIWVRRLSKVLRYWSPNLRQIDGPQLVVTNADCPGDGLCACRAGLRICCANDIVVSNCLGKWSC